MEQLRLVRPSLEYKEQGLDYIQEFYEYNSNINGVGGLDRYLNDYEGWLVKLRNDEVMIPSEERVPALTYYLVRESDNRIVGMVNIRLVLNSRLRESGGHIGYSIRPTERRKGYNKINLYLALLVCQRYGIKEVLLGCNKENLGSSRTMLALGARKIREFVYEGELEETYAIDVDASVSEYKTLILR